MTTARTFPITLLAAALTVGSSSPGAAQGADGQVKVSPFSVREVRERHLATGELKPEHAVGNSLTVTLLIEGPAVAKATEYSAPVVSEATDDQGGSLIEEGRGFGAGSFREIDREHMWFFEEDKPQDKIKIDVSLAAPPRGAKQVAKLSGTVALQQIVTESHRIGDLASLVGKKVEHPALTKAGAELQIVKFQPDEANEVLEFKLKDPNERVRSYSLVDAKGEKVSSGYGAFGFGGSTTVQMSGNDSVPKTALLELEIATGEPVVLSIPFKLTEPLALP